MDGMAFLEDEGNLESIFSQGFAAISIYSCCLGFPEVNVHHYITSWGVVYSMSQIWGPQIAVGLVSQHLQPKVLVPLVVLVVSGEPGLMGNIC